MATLNCTYSVQAPRIILRKGHVGRNYYIIFSGSVFVNVEDKNTFGDEFVKTETILSQGDAFGVNSVSS